MSTDTFFRPDPQDPQPIALERLQRWRGRHTPVAAVLAGPDRILGGPDRAVVDYGGMSALVIDSTGAVLDSWPTQEMTLLGVDATGRLAVFSEDFTWNHQVYDLEAARWLENADPDLPRFVYE